MFRNPRQRSAVTVAGLVLVLLAASALYTLIAPSLNNVRSPLVAGSAGSDTRFAAPLAAPTAPAYSQSTTVDDGIFLMTEDEVAYAAVPGDQSVQQPQQERVILKDATLNITVADVAGRIVEIGSMAEGMGGWIISSSTSQRTAYNGEIQTSGTINVRVPAERLTEALDRIKEGAEAVNTEAINGRDVTSQYIDLASRLANLEAAETQLQSIMESSTKVEDVLNVFAQLVSTRGEIESIKGQLQYFDEASTFSLVQVTLNPPAVSPVVQPTIGWSPVETMERAIGMLIEIAQGTVDLLITLVIVVLPPLLVIALPVYLVYRRMRRRATVTAPVTATPTS